jgi:hypothetical protein
MLLKIQTLGHGKRTLRKTRRIENKVVGDHQMPNGGPKKGGPKMKVSPTMLLKTNVEKMSHFSSAMMSLKTHGLSDFARMLMKMNLVSCHYPQSEWPDLTSDHLRSKWTQKCCPSRVGLEIGQTVTISLRNPPNPRGSNG